MDEKLFKYNTRLTASNFEASVNFPLKLKTCVTRIKKTSHGTSVSLRYKVLNHDYPTLKLQYVK